MNKLTAIVTAMALSSWCLEESCVAQEMVHQVKFPKGDAAWSVTFEENQTDDESSPPPKPKSAARQMTKVEIVREGNLRHDLLTWSDGSTTEYWWSANPAYALYQDGADPRVYAVRAGNMGGSKFDESYFTWISKDTFKGMRDLHDGNCRYYEMVVHLLDGSTATVRAWINNKTLQPVAWSSGKDSTVAVFSFDVPLPTDPLVMPANFKKALDSAQPSFLFPKRTPPANE